MLLLLITDRYQKKCISLHYLSDKSFVILQQNVGTAHLPPVAADINGANVKKLGFSDDPEESKYVNLEEDRSLKLLSVCQDLLYIFNSGKTQTQKSLALATAVR